MESRVTLFRLSPFECNRKFCFVRGSFPYDTRLMKGGGEVLPEMKTDGVALLEYHLDEDQGGLEIGDYFTTTENHLPVSRRFADAVQGGFNLGPCEVIPARIINAKGRVHVPDIAVLSPIDTFDCLDQEHSDMDGDPDDPMVQVFGRWSLLGDRVPADRDLFRVTGLIGYVFSQRLVNLIRDQGFKNFHFEDAPVN